MNRIAIFSSLFAGLTVCNAYAADVTGVRAGGLADAVGADTTAQVLKVTGVLDASDFAFIADRMSHISQLDISGCSIVAYSGKELPFSGLRSSAQAQLPSYSFVGMKNLESVVLPQTLTTIGTGAFSGSGIRSILVPDGVVAIADYAFLRCEGLESVELPASLEQLGLRTFANCTSLRRVVFAPGNSLDRLPAGVFEGSTSLQELNVDALAQCTEIGPWSLAHCHSLTEVVIPSAVKTLGRGAMLEDGAVENLALSHGVETFDEYSLAGLRQVATFSLPASVTFFASGAMADWDALSDFNVSALTGIPELGDGVWRGIDSGAVTLVVADDLAERFSEASQWQDFRIVRHSDYIASTTDIDSKLADSPYITVYVDGNVLYVRSELAELGTVSMFNTSGVRVALTDVGAGKYAEIDISSMPGGAYLVVTSSSGVAKIVLFK